MPRKITQWQERFWLYVEKPNSPEACWEWTGTLRPDGYGVLGLGGRGKGLGRAHVLSWLLHRGSKPNNLWVLHKCDNPSCVNPDHLFLGTHRQNMHDMIAKKRDRKKPSIGERNGNAKLSNEATIQLRVLGKALPKRRHGRVDFWRKLGMMFGVSYRTAQNIAIGHSRKGVLSGSNN